MCSFYLDTSTSCEVGLWVDVRVSYSWKGSLRCLAELGSLIDLTQNQSYRCGICLSLFPSLGSWGVSWASRPQGLTKSRPVPRTCFSAVYMPLVCLSESSIPSTRSRWVESLVPRPCRIACESNGLMILVTRPIILIVPPGYSHDAGLSR